jgi:hypothetical protein
MEALTFNDLELQQFNILDLPDISGLTPEMQLPGRASLIRDGTVMVIWYSPSDLLPRPADLTWISFSFNRENKKRPLDRTNSLPSSTTRWSRDTLFSSWWKEARKARKP